MASNTTPQFDSTLEADLELPVNGDGTQQSSRGTMTVGISHEGAANGQALIHLSLPDRFGIPQGVVDLHEDDAATLQWAINRLLDTGDQAEAAQWVQDLNVELGLAEESED